MQQQSWRLEKNVVKAFSLLAKIWGECSILHSLFVLFFLCFCCCFVFSVEISLRTLIPLFTPGSVCGGSSSWDDCGQMFPDKLHVSSSPDGFPHYAVPAGSPSRGGDAGVYVWHKPTELAHTFSFCSCVYFYLYDPFNCISFQTFSWHFSSFQFCSSGLNSALFVLSTIYHFMKVSLSPDIIPSGWLGSKHLLTN